MLCEIQSNARHSFQRVSSQCKRIWLVISLACLFWAWAAQPSLAQTPADHQAQAPLVTAAATSEFVRFTAPAKVYEMRLEVFAADGQTLYDSDFKLGNLLDWGLHNQQGQRLADGSYRCVVTIRALYGRATQKQGTVILQDGQPTLQAAQSPQEIKPLNLLAAEPRDFLTLPGKGAAPSLTALAHDGQQGRLVSGSGGLSFRTGDFFTGKDVEQMRLTADGKLGLGVADPQAKLDVGGLIRTSEGIVFPDGTVQTTAYVASGRSLSERAGLQRDAPGRSVIEQGGNPIGTENGKPLMPNVPAATVNRLAKFTSTDGTVGDSAITEVGGNVGIGTPTPGSGIGGFVGLDVYGNDLLAVRTRVRNISPGGYSILNFGNDIIANIGGFFVTGSQNPAYGGPNSLNLINTVGAVSLGANNASHVFIDVSGKVGIGATSPGYKLHVEGGSGTAIYGETSGGNTNAGVRGTATATNGTGVWGRYTGAGGGYGVFGSALNSAGYGVFGQAVAGGIGVVGNNTDPSFNSFAGKFEGKVDITGNLTVGGSLMTGLPKNFRIDHPLDPENKYLYHASIESSEVKNLYDGTVVLDQNGEAVVQLPLWFEVLNRDFRYQLTCIGGYAQVYIAEEITDNQFKIAGGRPGMKVSWQVTGNRQDPAIKAHPLQVEQEKPEQERGYYLHPELYGQPEEKRVDWARHPELMRQLKQQREKAQAEKKLN